MFTAVLAGSPVVEVVEQLVQLVPLLEPSLPGQHGVVGSEEGRAQAAEHGSDGQLELGVTEERARVEHH